MRVLALHRTHKNFFFCFLFHSNKNPSRLFRQTITAEKKRKKFWSAADRFYFFLLRGSDSAAAADGHPIHKIIFSFLFFSSPKSKFEFFKFWRPNFFVFRFLFFGIANHQLICVLPRLFLLIDRRTCLRDCRAMKISSAAYIIS